METNKKIRVKDEKKAVRSILCAGVAYGIAGWTGLGILALGILLVEKNERGDKEE